MIKITANSIMVCAILLCASTIAMAGSPYNLTGSAPGTKFTPHVAKPSLKQKPVISRSLGHAQQTASTYTAITKSKSRKQGSVSAGGVRWTCQRNRCTTRVAWAHPTAQACKSLAHAVGAIKSFSKRGASLNAGELSNCNAGIAVAKINKRAQPLVNRGFVTTAPVQTRHSVTQGGFAPKQASNGNAPATAARPHHGGFASARPSTVSGTTSGGSNPSISHHGGGFAPPGLAGQVHVRNALSRQQLARISGAQQQWERYKRAVAEKRRRDEAALRARIQRLSHEAYISGADCNDNDSQIRPDLLEVCDGKDNNCNEQIDEGVTILSYRDADGDGHGDPATAEPVCPSDITAAQSRGEWLSTTGNDCNDTDPDHWHDCPASGSSR